MINDLALARQDLAVASSDLRAVQQFVASISREQGPLYDGWKVFYTANEASKLLSIGQSPERYIRDLREQYQSNLAERLIAFDERLVTARSTVRQAEKRQETIPVVLKYVQLVARPWIARKDESKHHTLGSFAWDYVGALVHRHVDDLTEILQEK
jgi:hypothetical protein